MTYLFPPQHRTRNGAVVTSGLNDFAGRELDTDRTDANRVVGLRRCFRSAVRVNVSPHSLQYKVPCD